MQNTMSIMRHNNYPKADYGRMFHKWAREGNSEPYNSWGNGAAMRISAVGYAFDSLDEVLEKAQQYTKITHNHIEGIMGASATAAAIYLARTGRSKDYIRDHIVDTFGYNLDRSCDEIRPHYVFNESCQETVPEAMIAFLESTNFEHAIRLAVSLGGDSDTLTCITGGIAQAFYGAVTVEIANNTLSLLDEPLREVTVEFMQKYCNYNVTP